MIKTLESLKLSDSTCVLCGELLYDAKKILVKEQMEKNLKNPVYSNRTYGLPKDFHAYCINKACGNFRVDIPFGRLLLLKDVAELKKDVAELKKLNKK